MTLNRTEHRLLFASKDMFMGCEVLHDGSSGRYRCECSDVVESGCILRKRSCMGPRKEVEIDGLKRRHHSVMSFSGRRLGGVVLLHRSREHQKLCMLAWRR